MMFLDLFTVIGVVMVIVTLTSIIITCKQAGCKIDQ